MIQIKRKFYCEEAISSEGKGKYQPATDCDCYTSTSFAGVLKGWAVPGWAADISFDLPANLDDFEKEANVVCQLIEEGVINAIRHGKAKKSKYTDSLSPA